MKVLFIGGSDRSSALFARCPFWTQVSAHWKRESGLIGRRVFTSRRGATAISAEEATSPEMRKDLSCGRDEHVSAWNQTH